MNHYYSILGLDCKASAEEIKKAYRVLAQKYHPDAGSEKTNDKFHRVTEAYKVLSDPEKRKIYDAELGDPKKESVISAEPPSPPSHLYKERISPEREKELQQFYRNRFLKGIFKVVIMALLFFVLGFGLAWLLKGYRIIGGVLFALAGFFLGIGRNFELESFIASKKNQKLFKRVSWVAYGVTVVYFLFWILNRFV